MTEERTAHLPTGEPPFPDERAALEADLLARVAEIGPTLAAHRDQTESDRTLAPAAVDALRQSGLFRLKSPREVGGAEAHPVVQMKVIEAAAMFDPAASWCMFISSAVSGSSLARLPDDGVAEVMSGGFPCMAGSLRPGGKATPVEGGFRVSGRWSWGSGIPHADYVSAPVFSDDPDRPLINVVVPFADVELHDTWYVMGMKGTGSGDYELHDVFVPDRFVSDLRTAAPRRGGPLFRLGMPGYVVNEHGCFAYALGRLALRSMIDTAVEKKRGYTNSLSIADREVFQRAVSKGLLRMQACELLMADVVERLYDSVVAEPTPTPQLIAEARAAAVLCTDEAIDVVSTLFRYAGGSAVMLDDIMQRCLRDIYAVQSHLVVSDSAYEIHGQQLLGLIDDAPLR